MAELFRHTDGAGDSIKVSSGDGSGHLMVTVFPRTGFIKVIGVPEVDGRRLLAALLGYYGLEVLTEDQEERHG